MKKLVVLVLLMLTMTTASAQWPAVNTTVPGTNGQCLTNSNGAVGAMTCGAGSGTVGGAGTDDNLASWDGTANIQNASVGVSKLSGLDAGSVLFGGASGVLTEDVTNFVYDPALAALRIGPAVLGFTPSGDELVISADGNLVGPPRLTMFSTDDFAAVVTAYGRGGTNALPLPLSAGGDILQIIGSSPRAGTPTSNASAAEIDFTVDLPPTGDIVPGRIQFWTADGATGAMRQRYRVSSQGTTNVDGTACTANASTHCFTGQAEFQSATTDLLRANATGPTLRLKQSLGTLAAPTITSGFNSDILGTVGFYGYDGAAFTQGAFVKAIAADTPTSGKVPAGLDFGTGSDGSGLLTRWHLDQDGHFWPHADNAYTIGISSTRVKEGFFVDVTSNTLKVNGSSSGVITVQGAAAAGTWSLTLPVNDGDASQVLTTDGSGVTSWATPSAPSAASKVRSLTFPFDGNGAPLTTGNSLAMEVPYACTITGWAISVAAADTATFKLWRIATGTAIPTAANNLNTAGVALSTGTHVRSATVSDFAIGTGTAISANDIIIAQLSAVGGTTTGATFQVECTTL